MTLTRNLNIVHCGLELVVILTYFLELNAFVGILNFDANQLEELPELRQRYQLACLSASFHNLLYRICDGPSNVYKLRSKCNLVGLYVKRQIRCHKRLRRFLLDNVVPQSRSGFVEHHQQCLGE